MLLAAAAALRGAKGHDARAARQGECRIARTRAVSPVAIFLVGRGPAPPPAGAAMAAVRGGLGALRDKVAKVRDAEELLHSKMSAKRLCAKAAMKT